jgi:hypothetical protein
MVEIDEVRPGQAPNEKDAAQEDCAVAAGKSRDR